MKYTDKTKTLLVSGRLWSGVEGESHYAIDNQSEPKTFEDARQIAGDFDEVTRASVVTVTRHIEEIHRTIKS